jgi:GT2 family glycosyltransferase
VTQTTAGGATDPPLDDEAAAGAPAVVAVVVTHDPGDWLEECLAAVGASDYPNLSVLVIDAGSAEDPTGRVAAVLPSAYVRRLDGNPGFGAAANDVLEVVEGASHFVFLHDDAAPAPDAIRLLVEEAYRSNAGIVAPKVVAWDDPMMLLAVGMGADKTGHAAAYGRGELDQEQHDAVRDVFAAPGGAQLVRADLFETIGGFDPAMAMLGEDVDLCWRAQIAGARVVVAPLATVRHLEATATGVRPLDVDPPDAHVLELRHRVRTVLKAYGFFARCRIVPQLIVVMAVEAAFGGRAGWRAFFDAWRWNLREAGGLRAARRDVQRHRLVRDGDVRRLQTRSSRLTTAVRTGLDAEERTFGMGAAGRQLAGQVTRGGVRLTIATWASIAVVLVIGSRHLISGPLPAVGQLAPFPDGPSTLLRAFFSGWRTAGLGSESPAPFSFLLLGLGGLLTGGGMGLLQKLVVLGALPVGVVGAHRLTAPLGAWRARLLAAVLYAASPLPYDALSRGRWSALVAYAAMPWLLARLLRASGLAPFGAPAPVETSPHAVRRARRRRDAEEALGAEAGTLDAIEAEELRLAALAIDGRHHTVGEDDRDEGTMARWQEGGGGFGEDDGGDSGDEAAFADDRTVARRPEGGGGLGEDDGGDSGDEAAFPDDLDDGTAASWQAGGGRSGGRGTDGREPEAAAVPASVRMPGSFANQAVAAAVITAVAVAFAPPVAIAMLVAAVGLLAGSLLVGPVASGLRAIAMAAAAVAGAALLLVPWTFELVAPGSPLGGILGAGPPAADAPGLGELLRLHVGPMTAGWLSAGLLVAAVLPLAVGRGWRFEWAARLWCVAVVAVVVAWAAGRGWLAVPPPSPDVLLTPAVIALVLAAALGLAAFELDLPDYHFGWRQLASLAAGVAAAVSLVPAATAAVGGRWGLPSRDYRHLLAWMPEQVQPAGDFRVLWVGAADVLPTDGWRISSGVSYALSRQGTPHVVDLWPGSDQGATGLVADALGVARAGETTRLGALLGPFGVRYIAVPREAAPAGHSQVGHQPPRGLLDALRAQVDLRLIRTDDALVLFENAAWTPSLSATHRTGPVPAGDVLVSEAYSPRWHLEGAPHHKASGWANGFTVRTATRAATLRYRTSPVRAAALLLELALWVVAVRQLVLMVRRRSAALR